MLSNISEQVIGLNTDPVSATVILQICDHARQLERELEEAKAQYREMADRAQRGLDPVPTATVPPCYSIVLEDLPFYGGLAQQWNCTSEEAARRYRTCIHAGRMNYAARTEAEQPLKDKP